MSQRVIFQSFVLILLCFSNALKASIKPNGSLSGVVKDKSSGNAIQGASIMIADVKMGTSSNQDGNFYISNITDGKHLVEVSHLGYATIAVYVTISGETKHDFFLEASIIENNAVVVTGVSKATQLKKIPFQVSVLRKEDLLQTSSMNIIESITSKAGVSSVSTGPAISKPLIRGLGYNRVLTINDGVRQEGQQWGDEHGIEIDDASVNKIEVLKGPASLVYGSDAMAGVINIISNVPAPDKSIKATIGSEFQSNNQLRGINGNISGNKNGFNWNAYGTIKEAADYKNKYDGAVFNSKFNQQNVGGYVGYNGSWGFSHLLFSNFNLKAGLVEGERDSLGRFIKTIVGGNETAATDEDFKSTNPITPYQHIQHFKIATDNSIKWGQKRLTMNVGWQQNKREEFGNPDNLNERSLFFDLKTITYAAQLHLKETKGWKNCIGINGMQQQNENKGIEQLIPDYQLFDFGTYFFSQKEINKINISGGIRFDIRNMNVASLQSGGIEKGMAFSNKFSNYSGSIGLAYPISKKINVKFNIARAFRAPSIPELASNGAHEGTIRYEYGNQNLTSEISTQSDAAIEYTEEHFSLNVAGYWNHFSNFIYYRKLQSTEGLDSIIEMDGDQLTAFKFDQRSANLTGLEATLDIHPHPLDWLHIENTFSLVVGKFSQAIEGSNNLPFMPAPKLLTEFRGDFKKVHNNIKNFYVKLEIDNTFNQSNPFTAYNTETFTSGYTLLNLGLGATIINKKKKDILGIYFTASNVTDVAYQNHLSRLKYAAINAATGRSGVFNVGRNFGIKINVPLGFRL